MKFVILIAVIIYGTHIITILDRNQTRIERLCNVK